MAVLEENPAERGGKDALSRIRPRPLEHDHGRSPGSGFDCTAEHLSQGEAEASVFFRRPDGHPEEPPVETGEIVADADGDPLLDKAARQFGSGDVAPVDADQEEVSRSGIDEKPGDRSEFSGELRTPFADEAAGLLRVCDIAERRRSDGLREGVHRPGGGDGAKPPDDLPIGNDPAQAESGDGVEFGERPQDDEISRPSFFQEAFLCDEIGEGLVDDEERRGMAADEFPEGGGGKEMTRRIVRSPQENDLIPPQ